MVEGKTIKGVGGRNANEENVILDGETTRMRGKVNQSEGKQSRCVMGVVVS